MRAGQLVAGLAAWMISGLLASPLVADGRGPESGGSVGVPTDGSETGRVCLQEETHPRSSAGRTTSIADQDGSMHGSDWAVLALQAIAHDETIMHAIRSAVPKHVRHSAPVRALNMVSESYVLAPAALATMLMGEGDLRDTGRLLVAGIIVDAVVVDVLKSLAGRDRPDGQGGAGKFRGPRAKGRSFPSGQTAAMFTVATVVSERHPKAREWAEALAKATAASRLLLDRHHPSDVLAGALVGSEVGDFVLRNEDLIRRIAIRF